ncbi:MULTISPECIES: protein kinase [unclassified Leptospira]|uniref:protein kinase domain-containing protein n=1 Tax=unclassified Leptospira TaxID=2633828 RepID=UPI0002929B4F|nr:MULTISPECIES: protein kinase [unclassified Leptospira]EKO79847.1 kinase domain protein [Leptospira sp. Fiocruz LV3954]EMI67488.1 kinase domain protein [Leptospira sp. Fiocruz LV4135]
MKNKIIEFIRKKDFQLIREIGQGGYGRTVLLYDSVINQELVCKKYDPFVTEQKEEFYQSFVQEIKLLYMINHRNIVRVFNYYLYPEKYTGYILMEYINGSTINEYIRLNSLAIESIFIQTITGFSYLEENGILHRDIREQNILVDSNGVVKVIDFGFGKQVYNSEKFDNSVSLNWWCETPHEFVDHKYNYSTEIYFVGKLFEKIIFDNHIENFKYLKEIRNMIQLNPENRYISFPILLNEIISGRITTVEFNSFEKNAYRNFANELMSIYSSISFDAKFNKDTDLMLEKLQGIYRNVMLEDYVPSVVELTRCFVVGTYFYNPKSFFGVSILKEFIDLFRDSNKEKREIIINNLINRMESIKRYNDGSIDDNDIPF